jgi:hypothetical protein
MNNAMSLFAGRNTKTFPTLLTLGALFFSAARPCLATETDQLIQMISETGRICGLLESLDNYTQQTQAKIQDLETQLLGNHQTFQMGAMMNQATQLGGLGTDLSRIILQIGGSIESPYARQIFGNALQQLEYLPKVNLGVDAQTLFSNTQSYLRTVQVIGAEFSKLVQECKSINWSQKNELSQSVHSPRLQLQPPVEALPANTFQYNPFDVVELENILNTRVQQKALEFPRDLQTVVKPSSERAEISPVATHRTNFEENQYTAGIDQVIFDLSSIKLAPLVKEKVEAGILFELNKMKNQIYQSRRGQKRDNRVPRLTNVFETVNLSGFFTIVVNKQGLRKVDSKNPEWLSFCRKSLDSINEYFHKMSNYGN